MASASKSKVCFFFDGVRFSLSNREVLKKFVERLLKKEGRRLHSLNYIFCTDKALLDINKTHLKHDYYTDIITFDLSEDPDQLQGEVYISVDRVRENARAHQASFKNELHRVIFHGALHLAGYRDKTSKETALMRKIEDQYLSLYFKG